MQVSRQMNNPGSIANSWRRIETWGAEYAPAMLEQLNGPASIADIKDVEDALQLILPEDLKASLLIHNGETDGWQPSRVWAECGELLSCAGIIEQWRLSMHIQAEAYEDEAQDTDELIRTGIISVSGPVKPVGFLPKWIPIMQCNGDVFWHIDLDPAQGGHIGQVIRRDPECCSWVVCAQSLEAFLEQYASALENGAFTLDESGLPARSQS